MKIIIVGKGASGKDHLKKKFLVRGFKQSVSYTTRPPRSTELDGIDYHFVDEPTFKQMITLKEFREWNVFGEQKWYYGTTVREFNAASIFVMTPSGVKALTEQERKKCFVIYLDVPEEVRRERLCERNDADTPERRLRTDNEDFKDFEDYDMKITDHDF